MSVRFWKATDLCKVLICRSGLLSSDLTGKMGSLSRLMSTLSTKADIVAVFGCSADLVRKNDGVSCFPKGVNTASALTKCHRPECSTNPVTASSGG